MQMHFMISLALSSCSTLYVVQLKFLENVRDRLLEFGSWQDDYINDAKLTAEVDVKVRGCRCCK
jgi:hypothetical protein